MFARNWHDNKSRANTVRPYEVSQCIYFWDCILGLLRALHNDGIYTPIAAPSLVQLLTERWEGGKPGGIHIKLKRRLHPMKKGFFKSFAAVVMAMTMALSITTLAMASAATPTALDPSESDFEPTNVTGVEGIGTPTQPVIKVRVPLTMPFAIDPFHIDDTKYVVSNQSETPVLISYDLTLTVGSDIDLLDNVASVSNLDFNDAYDNNGRKAVVFGIAGANNYGTGAATKGEYASAAQVTTTGGIDRDAFVFTATPGSATSGGFAKAATDTGLIRVDFLLGAAADPDADPVPTLNASGAGIAAFKLTGEYTLGDNWGSASMSVKGYLSVIPTQETTRAKYIGTADKANQMVGMNQVYLSAAERPALTTAGGSYDVAVSGGGVVSLVVPESKVGDITIKLNDKPATITEIKNDTSGTVYGTGNTGTLQAAPNDTIPNYTYDPETGILKFTRTFPAATLGIRVSYGTNTSAMILLGVEGR